MPISTVSRRIAELEDQLGVRLLERSTRRLRLTELGAEVLEHAARTAELNDAVESIVSNRLSDVSGTLRLSAPPSISDTLLTPVVTASPGFLPQRSRSDPRNRSFCGSYRRRGRPGVPAWCPEGFVTDRKADPYLPAPAPREPSIPKRLQAAQDTAGPARTPASVVFALETR
ncbi:MAG: LysR family transcriptional regulator [Acetobacteraceae bacterium]|nr:LysR family transcriptional regulator [Acetobacteraceae bacterium]